MTAVSSDLSLFDDDEPERPAAAVPGPAPASDWQVDLLRKALDARGLTAQEERQAAIQEHVDHPVTSLRSLTHDEALRVLSRLGQSPAPRSSSGSSWDERDEDTWIDRL